MSETLYLFPLLKRKLGQFSFRIFTIGYMIVLYKASVNHTRLRLGFSCLREYLFKIDSCVSPICECSFDSESVKHFILYCLRYAAQRDVLITSGANVLDETWSSISKARNINFLLYGVESVNYDVNCALFHEVQSFIINTNRFASLKPLIVWIIYS